MFKRDMNFPNVERRTDAVSEFNGGLNETDDSRFLKKGILTEAQGVFTERGLTNPFTAKASATVA